MATNMVRTFEDKPAVREATPLLLGLIGPSGTGKTFSALRLATGIQRISGGDIYGIDTESRRMLHYADRFKFRHMDFGAPFGSLDYLAAIEHCVKKGAKTIIVDSMSHEHEGPGGVLEQHKLETERLAKLWKCSEDKAQMAAWSTPKQDRRRMINTILQMNANFIFCFRSKEKMKLGGPKPVEMGFMPIAGEEFVYEMVLKCLLLPGANGTPTWGSEYPGERMMMKLPEQFKDLFAEPKQLDEDTGLKLAQWAAGSAPPTVADYEACKDKATWEALEKRRADTWKAIPTAEKPKVKAASDAAKERLGTPAAPAKTTDSPRGDLAGPEPQFDEASALARIGEQTTKEAVDAVVTVIARDYEITGRELPASIEPAANDRKEALAQL